MRNAGWGRAGLLSYRWPTCRAFRRRRASIAGENRRDPRSCVSSPRRRAAKSCRLRVMVSSLLPPSLGKVARKQEGYGPRELSGRHEDHRAGWGNADRSPAPAPQSEPVTHASRLVARIAPLVAFGLRLRNLAAGPATYRQYSYRGVCGRESQNSSAIAVNVSESAEAMSDQRIGRLRAWKGSMVVVGPLSAATARISRAGPRRAHTASR